MNKKQLLNNNHRKKIGYSAAIGAILTIIPLSTANAEEVNIEEAVVAEQSMDKGREAILEEILIAEDVTQAIILTHEALTTYEKDQEFIELLQIQTDQLLNEAEELYNKSEFDEAAVIYSLLLELEVVSSDKVKDLKIDEVSIKGNSNEANSNTLNDPNASEKANLNDDSGNDSSSDIKINSETKSQDSSNKEDNSNQTDELNLEDSIEAAEKHYQEAITAPFASQAWQTAIKGYNLYPNDDRFIDAIDKAGDRMMIIGKNSHKSGNFARAIDYYDDILNNSNVSNQIKKTAEFNKKFAVESSQVKTAEKLYNESITAPYASQAWELSVYGAGIFPNDKRFANAITQAAERMMTIATNSHKSGNFLRAIEYYDQLIEEPLVPKELQRTAKSQKHQANKDLEFINAKNLYKEAITARYASEAWNAALEGYSLYPNDRRFLDAIAQAGNRLMIIGTNSHKNGDFVRAIEYYDRMISLNVVPKNLQKQAEIQKNQANNKQIVMSADDYYNEAMTARYASQSWAAATEGFNLYPNDKRFIEAVTKAGERILTIGMNSHKSGNFERATEYYNNLLSRSELPSYLINQASVFKSQAQTNTLFKTSDEYYNEATSARFASHAWAAATEGSLIFPNEKRFLKAIDQASRRMLTIGRNNHENKKIKTATGYYQILLNHKKISTDVKNKVQILNGFALKGKAIKAESDYVKEIKSAAYASQAWDVAVEAISIYGQNENINISLMNAANRQIQLGRQYEKSGDLSRAKPYFDRVSNQLALPLSIRKLAASYGRLLEPSYRPVVYIDAGHGGSDSGAYFGGVKESTLNLSTAKFLQAELLNRGYDVVMSRESDDHLTLEERSTKANAHDIDVLLSIHNNSMGGRGTAMGIETFIYHRVSSGYGQERDRDKFLTINPRIEDSLRLADYTHNQLIKQTGLNQRHVKGQNFHMVREPYLPSVLYELGFMDNQAELAKITQVSFHKQSALAIADGVDAYFNK